MKKTVHISGAIFYEKMKMKEEGKIKEVTEKKNKGKTKDKSKEVIIIKHMDQRKGKWKGKWMERGLK